METQEELHKLTDEQLIKSEHFLNWLSFRFAEIGKIDNKDIIYFPKPKSIFKKREFYIAEILQTYKTGI